MSKVLLEVTKKDVEKAARREVTDEEFEKIAEYISVAMNDDNFLNLIVKDAEIFFNNQKEG